MAKKSPVQGKKRGAPSTATKRAAADRKASSTMKSLQSSGLGDSPMARLTAMDQKQTAARRKSYDKKKAAKAAGPKMLAPKTAKAKSTKAPSTAKASRPSTPGAARKYDLYSNLAKNSTGAEKKDYQAKAKAVASKASAPKTPRKAGVRTLAKNVKRTSPGSAKAQVADNVLASASARKGSGFASFSKKANKMTAGASKAKTGKGSSKRTRSFAESKIKRDGIGRFASKGSSARK